MRRRLSHLADHIFRRNFQDFLEPIKQQLPCPLPNFNCGDKHFLKKINSVNSNILSQNEVSVTKDLLFGCAKLQSD